MNYEIDQDFIGVFDGVFSEEFCSKCIKYFEELDEAGLVVTRQDYATSAKKHQIDDYSFDLITSGFFKETSVKYVAQEFVKIFWGIPYEEYSNKYTILKDISPHQIYDIKLQKTIPGQGYHVWHCESTGKFNSNRLLAFTLYLNDVEEGGETEFLYLKKRFKPKKNRLLIWPAGFTHTHRGNQPISGSKYILTGWIEY